MKNNYIKNTNKKKVKMEENQIINDFKQYYINSAKVSGRKTIGDMSHLIEFSSFLQNNGKNMDLKFLSTKESCLIIAKYLRNNFFLGNNLKKKIINVGKLRMFFDFCIVEKMINNPESKQNLEEICRLLETKKKYLASISECVKRKKKHIK